MQLVDFKVISNEAIAKDVFRISLAPMIDIPAPVPGQFVNVQIDGHYLRRPISVCDFSSDKGDLLQSNCGADQSHDFGLLSSGEVLTLIYKVVGEGTKRMAEYAAGECLNILLWLGNGYTLNEANRPVLIGGGVGVPPLYMLAKALVEAGQKPTAILGFNRAEEVFYQEAFSKICDTIITTADGSMGTKGFVTTALAGMTDYGALYTCGPEPMLKAVYEQAEPLPTGCAQFSFERRMGCGFGACMVCSCKTIAGYKRICQDGPILTKEEILWT